MVPGKVVAMGGNGGPRVAAMALRGSSWNSGVATRSTIMMTREEMSPASCVLAPVALWTELRENEPVVV